MPIKIVTDSTSYIPKHIIDEYDISIVSLNLLLNDISHRELDLTNDTFYTQMNESNTIPTSSQPVPSELYSIFENIITNGDSVLGIFLSSDMSGTFSSSHLVRNMIIENYPNANIELMDSRTNCMQMGFIAIEAAKAAKAGLSMDEVIKTASSVLENSKFLFTPDSLDYLQKGGRIGTASALLGTILQIKPILTVQNGVTTLFAKVRTKKKTIETIINSFLKDIEGKTLGDVIVHHINAPEEGQLIATILEEKIGQPVHIQPIGPIIGLHVGPGSIGLAYFWKE
ncbi:MAG: DegV family protein [Clostridium sp.]